MIVVACFVVSMNQCNICPLIVLWPNSFGVCFLIYLNIGGSLDDVGKFWQSNRRHGLLNMVTSAAL